MFDALLTKQQMQARVQQFEKDVLRWQTKLNLNDWEITIRTEHLDCTDRGGVHAYVNMQHEPRKAKITLNLDFDEEFNSADTALHELLHIRLNVLLENVLEERSVNCRSVNQEEHGLIQLFMKLLRSS